MSDLDLRPVGTGSWPVLRRLWPPYQHDLSEHRGRLPDPDGGHPDARLLAHDPALADPDRRAYLPVDGDAPVGFALVRGLATGPHAVEAFFVVRPARRGGTGAWLARSVLAAHPGRWSIAFQDENAGAARFWRRLAADVAPGSWDEEARPVPGRPDLPPDRWISLRHPPAG